MIKKKLKYSFFFTAFCRLPDGILVNVWLSRQKNIPIQFWTALIFLHVLSLFFIGILYWPHPSHRGPQSVLCPFLCSPLLFLSNQMVSISWLGYQACAHANRHAHTNAIHNESKLNQRKTHKICMKALTWSHTHKTPTKLYLQQTDTYKCRTALLHRYNQKQFSGHMWRHIDTHTPKTHTVRRLIWPGSWMGAAYDLLISGQRRPLFVCSLPVQFRHKFLCPISSL